MTTLEGASLVNGSPLPDDGDRWSALAPRTGQPLEPTFGEATPEHVAAAATAAAGALGGPDLRRLFVTTAWEGMDDAERAGQPSAGDIFVRTVATPGLPSPRFAA